MNIPASLVKFFPMALRPFTQGADRFRQFSELMLD